MNEQIVSAALKTLNIDVDVSGDLTEDQIKEVTDKIQSYKVYDETTLNELKSNVRKDFRTTIEKEVTGKTLEKFEKDFKQKYGVELKQGEDYQNALELIDKVLTNKINDSSNDDEIKKELETLRGALKQKEEEKTKLLSETESQYKKRITDMLLNNEISKFEHLIDVSDELKSGQLEFIKYNFDKRYELREQDGQTVVFDKEKEEVVKNETDYSPESLTNVLNKMAPSLVKFKTNDPKRGRADEIINEPVTSVALKKFKTSEDFNKYLQDKQISPTSNEGIELYATWKKSQSVSV